MLFFIYSLAIEFSIAELFYCFVKRYRTRSFAEKTLVEVMERTWAFHPDDRIDVFEIVKILREASDRISRKGNKL